MSSLVEEMESKTSLNAEWKRIQQKTFTRWCNEHLKYKGIVMEDLTKDLCDGVSLIVLLEILSQKKLGRYNKKPRIYAQRMENVDMALNFITKTEKIRLVNIGSGDIVGGNQKLILGLIWTLILHYQISLGLGLDDEKNSKNEKLSAKKALLGYIQDRIPHKGIKDFTSCWNDGTAVAALVDAVAPGLCPEAETMDSKNALANAQYAMKLAEDWLGVPMVLGPEDMVNPNVDELSMMTYLSQYPEAKLKPGAPIRPKAVPSNVKVSGPGIKPLGLKKGLPAVFYVDTKEAGFGKLETIVEGPDGETETCAQDNKDGLHTCSYVPLSEGTYRVKVLWADVPIRSEPFKVYVSPGTDALACRAYGPGIEGVDLKECALAEFFVETTGAGEGELNVTVRGTKGPLDSVDLQSDETQEDLYHVSYTPLSPGQYTIEVTFAGLHIKDSPFKVRVVPDRPDASKCSAEGPGIESTELEINQETWFLVHTKGAGRGELVANARGPRGEVAMTTTEIEPGTTRYTYTPKESGDLVVTIKYGGCQIPGSRFRVQVRPPPRPDKCTTSGPGLAPKGVRINTPTHFHVKTKDAGRGNVDVNITGPNDIIVPYSKQSAQHSHDYTYTVDEPGQYNVDIKFADQHIPGSPFPVAITDVSKVKITGPGMNGEPVLVSEPLQYSVDTKGAGPGEVACHVTESVNEPQVITLDENSFEILYTPTDVGLQKMNITFNEAPVPKTPLRISIYDPSKVLAKGPGLEPGNKSGDTTYFNIDKRHAGEGRLLVSAEGPVDTPVLVKDQANDIVQCEYTPETEGEYVINICLEDRHVPGSPFHVYVKQKANPSLVVASGKGLQSTGLTTDTLAEFTVDYTAAGDGEVQVSIEGPAGGVEFEEELIQSGITKYTYHTDPDENGRYIVQITFADEAVPGSPFLVNVNWKSDPMRVVAEGAGLEGGTSKEWAEFMVDLQKAGDGDLDVNATGPSEIQIKSFNTEMKPVQKCNYIEDGLVIFRYFPELPGVYTIPITFNGVHVPGSPFKPVFELGTDPTKCTADGPGLREHGVKVGDPGEFLIDTTQAGPGAVDVMVSRPQDNGPLSAKPIITSNNNGTYSIVYNPRRVGTYHVSVIFADSPIPGSPFTVNVTDPMKIILRGPGCGRVDEETQLPVNSPVQWVADTSQAGPGSLAADVTGQGESEELIITNERAVYQLEYQPKGPGLYQLSVSYSGNVIDLHPEFAVFDAERVLVYGPAFEGVNLGEEALFYVDCSEAGNGQLSMDLLGPADDSLKVLNESEGSFDFVPSSPGVYELRITYGSLPVPGSPFCVPVRDISHVVVSGSGITGKETRVGTPATVTVDTTKSGPAVVSAIVTDPSGKRENLKLNSNGDLHQSFYTPTEPGFYGVEVTYNNDQVPGSPFQVPISAPESVTLQSSEYAFVGQDNVIACNTKEAGPGVIDAIFIGPGSTSWRVTPEIDQFRQDIHYFVDAPGTYKARVLYNSYPVEEQMRTIEAVDLRKCIVSGPGIEPTGLRTREETYFEVDTQGAGKGNLKAQIDSPNEKQVHLEVTEIGETSYKVRYTPTDPGDHNITLYYNEREIEASPICVSIADPAQVTCTGPGLTSATVNKPAEFLVDVTKAGRGTIKVNVDGPGDVDIDYHDNENGTHTVTYVANKPGPYSVDVKYADGAVTGSPFQVECQRPPPDSSKCIVSGLNNPGHFTVDCSNAGGAGLLEVGVCGSYVPVEFVSVKHNGDYTFSVSYDIATPGRATISVKWHDQHLVGSPFVVQIEEQ